MSKRFGEASKNKIFALLCIFILVLFASCGGGGGGGGGAVSFAPNSNMPHNGGDAGGWGTGAETGGGFGGTSIEEANATLLIGQVPALDVTNVNIVLYVNGTRFEINNVNETTTTEVLPKISIGDTVSGTAYIYVAGEAQPREALLDPQAIGFHNTLKFKVPYKYECIDKGTTIETGTYFYADGIDLSSRTTARIAGWLCSDGTMHYGSQVNGVRGDITLTSVYEVAVTSNINEISKPSNLISALGLTADSSGAPLKPAAAQLYVYGSDNYSFSYNSNLIDVSAAGVVTIANGHTPPLAGETVSITVTDNDDTALFAAIDLTLSSQCVLAMYKDKASHDAGAGAAPDYTKFFGGSGGATSSGNLYALAGSLIEARKSALTQNPEQISDWQQTTPSSAKPGKTVSIDVTADTKLYALYSITVSSNVPQISKPSELLALLIDQNKIGTQDSAGTLVMPKSAQLTVTGSDSWSFEYDASKVSVNSSTGVVTVAAGANPSIRGENVTITVKDDNDPTITNNCTIKICSQAVCAIYIDKATCDANGTPGYTKILDNTVSSLVPPSMNVKPYDLVGSQFVSQHGGTISGWKDPDYTSVGATTSEYSVSGDKKIYAGWAITGIDTSERTLWRYTGVNNDNQTVITKPGSGYSSKWKDSTLVGSRINTSFSGNNVTISVTNLAVLDPLKKNATLDGEYQAIYQIYKSDDPASFTEIPITVKDAIYVDDDGELHFTTGATIPSTLMISTLWGGKTVTKIADNAFFGNTNIQEVTINGPIEVGQNAFKNCPNLTTVSVLGAAKLGYYAFGGCALLNDVTLNGAIESEQYSFSDCPSLTTVSLSNIKTFGFGMFCHAPLNNVSITNINPSDMIQRINGVDEKVWSNVFWYANGTSETGYPAVDSTARAVVRIPRGFTRIGGFTAAHIKEVHIPNTVTSMEDYGFDYFAGDIYFEGTQAEWDALKDSRSNISPSRVNMHYNQY